MNSRRVLADFGRATRQRLSARTVLTFGAVLALAYGVTREADVVLGVALGLTVVETVQALGETPSIDDQWVGLGIGGFVTVASLGWLGYELATGPAGPVWFPVLTALAGVWFVLDARAGGQTYGNDEEMDATEVMTVLNHAALVVDELKDGPKTVPELAEACDLTESRVREALDVGRDDGTIYVAESDTADDKRRYALDESRLGLVAFVRLNGARLLNRLRRPFR